MVFSDSTYSVLIVSGSTKFNNVISGMLPVNQYYPVITVSDIEEARNLFFSRGFDLVILNTALPNDSSIRLAADICDKSSSGVIYLAQGDYYEDVRYKLMPHGVLTVSKPVTQTILMQTLSLACATIERMKFVMKKQATVEEKISEMRLVNKAKWMLIDRMHMTEPEAHRFIEKKAMDDRVSKREVAERIIDMYSDNH